MSVSSLDSVCCSDRVLEAWIRAVDFSGVRWRTPKNLGGFG